ncbi:hypothetical protein [Salana multivorans]
MGAGDDGLIWELKEVGRKPHTYLAAGGTSPLLRDGETPGTVGQVKIRDPRPEDLETYKPEYAFRTSDDDDDDKTTAEVVLELATTLAAGAVWLHERGLLEPGVQELKLRAQRGWARLRRRDPSEFAGTPLVDRLREMAEEADAAPSEPGTDVATTLGTRERMSREELQFRTARLLTLRALADQEEARLRNAEITDSDQDPAALLESDEAAALDAQVRRVLETSGRGVSILDQLTRYAEPDAVEVQPLSEGLSSRSTSHRPSEPPPPGVRP